VLRRFDHFRDLVTRYPFSPSDLVVSAQVLPDRTPCFKEILDCRNTELLFVISGLEIEDRNSEMPFGRRMALCWK